jgi:hypothetical protein
VTARRPPSLRDPENYGQRLSSAFRALGVGSDGGRVLQTAPVQPLPDAAASELGSDVAEYVNTVTASGSAQTLPEPEVATVHVLTLTANCTLTFPDETAGRSFTLVLGQDSTGSRAVTWPGTVRWAGGTAPTLTTTASKRDVFSFLCPDGSTWLAFVAGQNYA